MSIYWPDGTAVQPGDLRQGQVVTLNGSDDRYLILSPNQWRIFNEIANPEPKPKRRHHDHLIQRHIRSGAEMRHY